MPQDIPVDSLSDDSRQATSLDGTAYLIDLSWSTRSETWYISVFQPQGVEAPTPVIQGIALRIGYPVLAGVVMDGRPLGEIIAVDLSGAGDDPGHEDLGTRVRLYYYTAAELGRV